MNLPSWIVDPNSNRINFHEPFDIKYWTEEWQITEQNLRDAKESIGSSIVSEVYRHLKLSGFIRAEDPAGNMFKKASFKLHDIEFPIKKNFER